MRTYVCERETERARAGEREQERKAEKKERAGDTEKQRNTQIARQRNRGMDHIKHNTRSRLLSP